jgi:hypothetical protein
MDGARSSLFFDNAKCESRDVERWWRSAIPHHGNRHFDGYSIRLHRRPARRGEMGTAVAFPIRIAKQEALAVRRG